MLLWRATKSPQSAPGCVSLVESRSGHPLYTFLSTSPRDTRESAVKGSRGNDPTHTRRIGYIWVSEMSEAMQGVHR